MERQSYRPEVSAYGQYLLCSPSRCLRISRNIDLRTVLILLIEMMPTHHPEQRPAGSTYPAHRDDAYASSDEPTRGFEPRTYALRVRESNT